MSPPPDVPPELLARARRLHVRPLTPGRYEVTGGSAPHVVDLTGPTALCDCGDHQHRGRACKHLVAVALRRDGTGAPAPAEAERPTRFRLLDDAELGKLPPPAWLLESYLPQGGLGVLYGPPGACKTFVALAWTLAVATGEPWLGRAVTWGPAVYIAAEGGRAFAQRVVAYRDAHAIPERDAAAFFLLEPVNLLAAGDVDALLRAVAYWVRADPALIVADTVARCMAGGDENSAQDVGRVIASVDVIRRATHAHVLLVHHTQKSGELERGSSALRGAADAMFALKNEDGLLTLECTKQKDAQTTDPMRLRLVPVGPSCIVEPLESEPAPTMTPTAWKLLRDLAEVFEGGGSAMAGWVRVSGVPERSAYRTAKHLLAMGYIAKDRSRYVVTTAGATALKSSANACQ